MKNSGESDFRHMPRGVLGTIGIPGEIVHTRDHLRIHEYSNKVYWKFAPYLESVQVPNTHKCSTNK